MDKELPVLRIASELDETYLIGRSATVVVGKPGVAGELLADPNYDDVALFLWPTTQLLGYLVKIQWTNSVVERNDFHELLSERAVEEVVGLQARHTQVLRDEPDDFRMLSW